MSRTQHDRRPIYFALAFLLLAGTAAAASVARPDEAAVIGVTAVFAVLVLSCYYWVVLILFAFRRSGVGAIGVLAANAAALVTVLLTDDTQVVFAVFSWAVLAVLAALLVSDVRSAVRSGWTVPPVDDGDGAAGDRGAGRSSVHSGGSSRRRPKQQKHAAVIVLPRGTVAQPGPWPVGAAVSPCDG
jgi:hypothetical protein